MRILVFGAGAIGSLFSAKLSLYNDVTLLSRKEHAESIKKNGLILRGKTEGVYHVDAIHTLDHYTGKPDIIIITVKSYDTREAIQEVVNKFGREIRVMSLQNGLDNLEKIEEFIRRDRIFLGLTTEGCIFLKPGEVLHAGTGKTIVGSPEKNEFVHDVMHEFRRAGFDTEISQDIIRDMWKKAIVNACINPLTAIFEIKNGELKREILFDIVKDICMESVDVARASGLDIGFEEMIEGVRNVIESTSENLSSMLQSIRRKKKTEIDSINGYICKVGKKYGKDVKMNSLLTDLVKIREVFT